jgi:hypothetical protein
VGSFHYKRQAPDGDRQERARCQDTRVFGASILVSWRSKPETVSTGSEHAARGDPLILGRAVDMEQERGAFKVNRARPESPR